MVIITNEHNKVLIILLKGNIFTYCMCYRMVANYFVSLDSALIRFITLSPCLKYCFQSEVAFIITHQISCVYALVYLSYENGDCYSTKQC